MKATLEVGEKEVQASPEVRRRPVPAKLEFGSSPAMVRPLFSDCLVEYQGHTGRQTLATLISFILQCMFVGVLILIPLYFTQQLPKSQLLTFLVAPPPPPPPPPPAEAHAARIIKQESELLASGGLRTPGRIPTKIQMIKEEEAPPPMAGSGVVGGVPGGIPGGQLGGVIGGIVSSASNLNSIPKLQPVVPKRVRISEGVTTGLLIHKVEPVYPILAKTARISGTVVLKAIIDREGNIQDLQLVSGHPMLVANAIAAVKQWHYRPYLLNGQPVEVETTINVIFTLTG